MASGQSTRWEIYNRSPQSNIST